MTQTQIIIGWELGDGHGWGIHGLYLARRLMERGFEPLSLGPTSISGTFPLPHPVMQAPGGAGSAPAIIACGNNPGKTISYPLDPRSDAVIAVFEKTDWDEADFNFLRAARRVITVSDWNARFLKENGINAECAHLGVDPLMFKSVPVDTPSDEFVIFSGGKPELRKGQDVVLAAFRYFQRMHPEAKLVTAWHNHWPATSRSLDQSPHKTGSPLGSVVAWSEACGVPLGTHRDVGLISRKDFAGLLRTVDAALFPNRCEGGTNMVAMECIAAGVPTILSNCPGHTDLIKDGLATGVINTTLDSEYGPGTEHWAEPVFDSVLEQLETIYHDCMKARVLAAESAERIARGWNWDVRMDDQIDKLDLENLYKPAAVKKLTPTNNQAEGLVVAAVKARDAKKDVGALALARRSYAMEPTNPRVKNEYANVLITLGHLKFAKQLLLEARDTIETKFIPHVEANLGLCEHYSGNDKLAIEHLKKAVGIQTALWDLANVQLCHGDWNDGWANYEVRRLERPKEYPKKLPEWDGTYQRDKTLLVYVEQGNGDVLMFSRYLAWAKERVRNVVFLCYYALTPFFFDFDGVDLVIAHAEGAPFPHADMSVPLCSLPLLHGTTVDTVPPDNGSIRRRVDEYLKETPVTVQAPPNTTKVGLVWRGNAVHARDRDRSISLEKMLMLTSVPNASFFSLQVGPGAQEIEQHGVGYILCDLAPQLTSWIKTAAAIMSLDLVITVDTAVAHLAGVLGKPVWTLISRTPDWRWLRNRSDTVWYPSMKLYRQTKTNDWDDVMSRVLFDLKQFKP